MDFYAPGKGVRLYLRRGDMPPRHTWVPGIIGWRPVYLRDFGNASVAYGEDGSEMVFGRDARWVLRQVAAFHCISYDQMRREFVRLNEKSQYARWRRVDWSSSLRRRAFILSIATMG
jgi:hypothetical protein